MLMPLVKEMPGGPAGVALTEKSVHITLFGGWLTRMDRGGPWAGGRVVAWCPVMCVWAGWAGCRLSMVLAFLCCVAN